jgi:hypothetical protein
MGLRPTNGDEELTRNGEWRVVLQGEPFRPLYVHAPAENGSQAPASRRESAVSAT